MRDQFLTSNGYGHMQACGTNASIRNIKFITARSEDD